MDEQAAIVNRCVDSCGTNAGHRNIKFLWLLEIVETFCKVKKSNKFECTYRAEDKYGEIIKISCVVYLYFFINQN